MAESIGTLLGLAMLVAVAFFFIGPFIVMAKVAAELRRSDAFMLWGFGGWFGAVLGLLWLIAVGPKEPGVTSHAGRGAPQRAPTPPAGDTPVQPVQRQDSQPGPTERRMAERRAARSAEPDAGSRWVRHYLHECASADKCAKDAPTCAEGNRLYAAFSGGMR
jgi:hypothetical protein